MMLKSGGVAPQKKINMLLPQESNRNCETTPKQTIDTYSLQIKNYNHADPGFSLGRSETINEVTLKHAEYLLIIEF